MSKGANNTYFGDILEGITSLWEGLKVTFRHFIDARKKRPVIGVEDASYFNYDIGIVTTEYPKEAIPVPDNGRYRLHNEIDDCIVCDLCAKICPVDCIEIEPVKSTEEIGKTSDGTTKRLYAAKFDIDMAKCCYCGLCTTVCPTECLTMTKTYDYSEYDISNMIYHFTNLSPEEAEKRKKLYEESIRLKELEREKQKAAKASVPTSEKTALDEEKKEVTKTPFKPVIKAPAKKEATDTNPPKPESSQETVKPKPIIKPVIKPKTETRESTGGEVKGEGENIEKPKAKPVIKPVIKPRSVSPEKAEDKVNENEEVKPKPKPVIKPVIKAKGETSEERPKENQEEPTEKPKAKPVIKPIIKPRIPKKDSE